MDWICRNAGNIITILLLLLAFAAAFRRILQNRRMGKGSCGGDCSRCSHCVNKDWKQKKQNQK
ncbi:MAG: FeoB-associated Cys-rich membrane protein [Blautia sp.]|nr:FeoB-associated Cys-rich membrane protein [Blautia sp.]